MRLRYSTLIAAIIAASSINAQADDAASAGKQKTLPGVPASQTGNDPRILPGVPTPPQNKTANGASQGGAQVGAARIPNRTAVAGKGQPQPSTYADPGRPHRMR